MKQVKILNVSITNEKKDKVLEYLFDRLLKPHEKTFITTPNPEMLVYASKHLDYQDKLNSAVIALPDGVGLSIAGQLLSRPIKERITGVDFIRELCEISREKPLSMGFLGGWQGVAEEAVKRLQQSYPWIKVVFVGEDEQKLRSSNTTIDILFVAYGVPKQEEWISENLPKLPIKAAIGVGGAFDFLSGRVRRAPSWMRKLGLEWLFRLIVQPWRFKRQLALFTFIRLVLKEKFH